MVPPRTQAAFPYALVLIGSGQRSDGGTPFTKLAYLTKPVVEDGNLVGYRGHAMNAKSERPNWSTLYRSERFFDYANIVKDWRRPPSLAAIKKAKAGVRNRARGAG